MADSNRCTLELLWDEDMQQHVLVQLDTEEKVYLPERATWQLWFSPDGDAFIESALGGAQHWADDLFCCTVLLYPDNGKDTYVMVDDQPLLRHEYKQRHTPVKVPFIVLGESSAHVKAYVLHQSVGGAWVLWCLKSLWKEIIDDPATTPSRWYMNWWGWWAKSLGHMQLDVASHLRKAAPTKHACEEDVDPALRFLQEASMSTFALFHLLARWSSESRSHLKKKRSPS